MVRASQFFRPHLCVTNSPYRVAIQKLVVAPTVGVLSLLLTVTRRSVFME